MYGNYNKKPILDLEGQETGEFKSNTNWDYYGLGLFNLVTFAFYRLIKAILEDGGSPRLTLDFFGINLFTQFLLCFTRYAWYIYLCIPGYLGYKLLGYAWSYVTSTNDKAAFDKEAAKVDPKEAKRLEKKQRKEEKPRVKYIK